MALDDRDTGTFPGDQLQQRVMADLYGWDGSKWIRISVSGGGGIVTGAVPNRGSFATNQVAVASFGTAQQLQSQAIPDGFAVVIKAFPANTKTVYIANSKVNAQNHSLAFPLNASEFVRTFITNTNLVWVDSLVNSEGVAWFVET